MCATASRKLSRGCASLHLLAPSMGATTPVVACAASRTGFRRCAKKQYTPKSNIYVDKFSAELSCAGAPTGQLSIARGRALSAGKGGTPGNGLREDGAPTGQL